MKFKPQTELGKKLLEIRQQAIAKGMQLKTTDEILAEIREDRGEQADEAHRINGNYCPPPHSSGGDKES